MVICSVITYMPSFMKIYKPVYKLIWGYTDTQGAW
jgi:hypothetical protein